jgi:hypothetical protein
MMTFHYLLIRLKKKKSQGEAANSVKGKEITFEKLNTDQAWWLTPVISPIWEAEIRRTGGLKAA